MTLVRCAAETFATVPALHKFYASPPIAVYEAPLDEWWTVYYTAVPAVGQQPALAKV